MWNAFNPIQWSCGSFVFVTFRIVLMNEYKLKIRLIKKQHHYDNINLPTDTIAHSLLQHSTLSAISPPVPLVVMEGLPRLFLSSLELAESPPPTRL